MRTRRLRDNLGVYLGDAVYARVVDGEMTLYTSNGIEETNVIVLEPEVLARLEDFVLQHTTEFR
jgi:hypothetical protein